MLIRRDYIGKPVALWVIDIMRNKKTRNVFYPKIKDMCRTDCVSFEPPYLIIDLVTDLYDKYKCLTTRIAGFRCTNRNVNEIDPFYYG